MIEAKPFQFIEFYLPLDLAILSFVSQRVHDRASFEGHSAGNLCRYYVENSPDLAFNTDIGFNLVTMGRNSKSEDSLNYAWMKIDGHAKN